MCDPVDAYVERMSYMRITEDSGDGRVSGSRPEGQVPVNRNSRSHNISRSVGAIESFIDGDTRQQPPPPDYKMYERENIIAASRFATPKSVEAIGSRQQAPVYENVDYYPQNSNLPAHPPYYHPVETRNSPRSSPRGSVAGDNYEATTFRKAQPQVPPGSRYQSASSPAKELPPYEAPPVYENIQEVHGGFSESPSQQRQQQNKPCPQVPNFYHPANMEGGDYVVMTGKMASQSHQRPIGSQSRSLSYDGVCLQRGSLTDSSSLRYVSSPTEGSKNAYVPPSELHLQGNRTYTYSPEQHSPRTSQHPAHREQDSTPAQQQSPYRDQGESMQQSYRQSQNIDQSLPSYRGSPNQVNTRSASLNQANYQGGDQARNSPPVYTSMPGRNNSPSYLSGRSNRSDQNQLRAQSQDVRGSPKASPTRAQISPAETIAQMIPNSVGHARMYNLPPESVPPSPVRGQVQPAVTSASQSIKDETAFHRPRITSLPPGVTSGVAGPVYLSGGVPQLQKAADVKPETPKSVTPPIKPAPGKGLLPYNVTPPRPSVSFVEVE